VTDAPHDTDARPRPRTALGLALRLASALALLGLGYLLTIALVRWHALSRIDADLERLIASGAPVTLAQAFDPPVPPEDDAMELLQTLDDESIARLDRTVLLYEFEAQELAELFQSTAALRRVMERARTLEMDEWAVYCEAKWPEAEVPNKLTPEERRTVLDDLLAPHASTIATMRRAAARPAVRATAYESSERRDEYALVPVLVEVLCLEALRAAEYGRWAAVRDDLALTLHFVRGLDAEPSNALFSVQEFSLMWVSGTLQRVLHLPEAGRELQALDAELARFDPWRTAGRVLVSERARWAEDLAGLRAPDADVEAGIEALWQWPADELSAAELLTSRELSFALSRLPAERAFVDPRFAQCLSAKDPGARHQFELGGLDILLTGGRQLQRLTLMRAALCARFEGLDSARARLAGTSDIISGRPIGQRLETDGSLTLWCSSSPHRPVSADGSGDWDCVIRVPLPQK